MRRVIDFFCTQCGKRIGLAEQPAGGQAQCPFCHAVINVPPAGVPGARAGGGGGEPHAWWMGDQLVVPRGAALPRTACAICTGNEGIDIVAKKFKYLPPYASLIGIIGLMMRKVEFVGVPLCRACARRWTTVWWAAPLLMILGIFALPTIGGFLGCLFPTDEAILIGVVLGFALLIAGIIAGRYLWVGRRTLICKHIDEAGVHLAFPDANALRDAWSKNA